MAPFLSNNKSQLLLSIPILYFFLWGCLWIVYDYAYLNKCNEKRRNLISLIKDARIISSTPNKLSPIKSWKIKVFGNTYTIPATKYELLDITLDTNGNVQSVSMVTHNRVVISIWNKYQDPRYIKYVEESYNKNIDDLSCRFAPFSSFERHHKMLLLRDPGAIYYTADKPEYFMIRRDLAHHSTYESYDRKNTQHAISYSYYGNDREHMNLGEKIFYERIKISKTPHFIVTFSSYIEDTNKADAQSFQDKYGIRLNIHKIHKPAPKSAKDLLNRINELSRRLTGN